MKEPEGIVPLVRAAPSLSVSFSGTTPLLYLQVRVRNKRHKSHAKMSFGATELMCRGWCDSANPLSRQTP